MLSGLNLYQCSYEIVDNKFFISIHGVYNGNPPKIYRGEILYYSKSKKLSMSSWLHRMYNELSDSEKEEIINYLQSEFNIKICGKNIDYLYGW